jgi:predicted AAA+ superfamily ATPase
MRINGNLGDISLKYCIIRFNLESIATTLENIVYLELRRRRYDVYTGKNAEKEIDFVATRRDERMYIQVCRNLPEASSREIDNLMQIRDHYPKFVLTLDELACGNINGIRVVKLIDFLLEKV